ALHALAADVGAHALAALGDLVDFVDEDNAVLLAGLDRSRAHFVLVDQLAGLFLDQQRARGMDRHAAPVGLAAAEIGEHLPQLLAELPRAGRGHAVATPAGGEVEFDLALVELAGAQLATQLLPGLGLLRRRFGTDVDGGAALGAGAE